MTDRAANWIRFAIVIFALAVALALPTIAMGQDTTTATSEVVTSQTVDEILTRLDAVVDATVDGVQVGAEFTWPILIRQQVIQGTVGVILIFFGFFILSPVALYYTHRLSQGSHDYGLNMGAVGGFLTIVVLVPTLVAVGSGHVITKILNPEYHALMDVLTALGLR